MRLSHFTPTLVALSLPSTTTATTHKSSCSSYTFNASSTISTSNYPTTPLEATAWSLIYTYPLAIFSSWAGGVLRTHPVNTIFHQRNLASPQDPGVIKPNVDTLYSRVVLDLSAQDVVLTVPEFDEGRYWVYPVYDPFGNNQAEIGVVNGTSAGEYLIRRAADGFWVPGFSNDTSTFNSTAHKGVVNLPGRYATMLIRILLLQNTTDDLDRVHTFQNQSGLRTVERSRPVQVDYEPAPSLQSLALNGSLLGIQGPKRQLEFAARIVPYSQPQLYSERYWIATILATAGLFNGTYHTPKYVNLTQAAVLANQSITADINRPENVRLQGNDWYLSTPERQGNFGTSYTSTAYVALEGYQQQTVKQTLYPGYRSLGFTSSFTLPDNGALLVTFSGKPKIVAPGFWSLTLYGPDQSLIPNEFSRFEVGDRNYDLRYDDGDLIYGPNANASKDGPFRVLIQPANVRPPANWTGNWLPAAEKFTWLTRWYVPSPAMTNGSYVYPKVENITAIV